MHNKARYSLIGIAFIAVALLAILFLFGPTGTGDISFDRDNEELIARVNGEDITLMQVKARERQLLRNNAESAEPLDAETIRSLAIDDVLIETLLFQDAKERGVTIDQSLAEERYADVRSNYDSEAAFEERLAVNFLTKEQFRENIIRQLTLQAYFEEIAREEILGSGDKTITDNTGSGTSISIDIETTIDPSDVNQIAQKKFLELAPFADIEIFVE